MLNEGYKYSIAINDKGESFPPESLIMTLIITTKNDRLANIANP